MINSFVLLAALVICVAQEMESLPQEFGSVQEFLPVKKFSKSRIWRVSKNSSSLPSNPANADFSANFVNDSAEKVYDRLTTWEDLTKSLGKEKIKLFLNKLPLNLLKNVTRIARKNPKLGEKKLIELFFQRNDSSGKSKIKSAKINPFKDLFESHEKASLEHQEIKQNSEEKIQFHHYSTSSFSTTAQPSSLEFEVPKFEHRLPYPPAENFRDNENDHKPLTFTKQRSSSEAHSDERTLEKAPFNSLTNSGYFLPDLTTAEPQTIEYVDSEFPTENNVAQGPIHTFRPHVDDFLNPPMPDSEVHEESPNHEKLNDYDPVSSVWRPPYPYSQNVGESQQHVFYTASNSNQSFANPSLQKLLLPTNDVRPVDQRRGPDTITSTEMESTESRLIAYRNDNPNHSNNYSYAHSTVHYEPPSKTHSVKVIDSYYSNDRGSSLTPSSSYPEQYSPQAWVSQPVENSAGHQLNNNNNHNYNSPSSYQNENEISNHNQPQVIYRNIPEKLNDSPSSVWSTDVSHQPISVSAPAPSYSPVPIVESHGVSDSSGWGWSSGKYDSFWYQFKSYFTKGDKSTAEKVFEISIGILSFLAFGGYMLMLIYQVFAVSSSFPLFPLFNKTVPQNPTLFGLLVGRGSTDGSYRVNPNAVFDTKYIDELESIVKSAMERVKVSWFSMSGSKNVTGEAKPEN